MVWPRFQLTPREYNSEVLPLEPIPLVYDVRRHACDKTAILGGIIIINIIMTMVDVL
jgi:hypothetical protein